MSIRQLQRILLVDDDADIQTVVKMALEIVGGFTIEVCSCGSEAIQKIPLLKPDLVLLDVMLPGMDGPTILEAIKKVPDLADMPIIFLTAKVQTHDIEYYRQLGVIAVLEKPFNPMTLSSRILDIWNTHYEQCQK